MYLQAESGKHCGSRATKHQIENRAYNTNFVTLLSTILLSWIVLPLYSPQSLVKATVALYVHSEDPLDGKSSMTLHTSIPKKLQHCNFQEGMWLLRLVHLPLVLEVPGSIHAHSKENFGTQTHFP